MLNYRLFFNFGQKLIYKLIFGHSNPDIYFVEKGNMGNIIEFCSSLESWFFGKLNSFNGENNFVLLVWANVLGLVY